jgi:iron complex outermembrane receptor protein
VNDVNSDYADAYTVTNLALGFAQRAQSWRLSEFLRIDNLADTKYIGSVIVNAAADRFYEPAPGRSAMLGVQAKLPF